MDRGITFNRKRCIRKDEKINSKYSYLYILIVLNRFYLCLLNIKHMLLFLLYRKELSKIIIFYLIDYIYNII